MLLFNPAGSHEVWIHFTLKTTSCSLIPAVFISSMLVNIFLALAQEDDPAYKALIGCGVCLTGETSISDESTEQIRTEGSDPQV